MLDSHLHPVSHSHSTSLQRAVLAVLHMSSNVMQDLIASTNEFDASGNPKLADIGMHLKKILKQYFDRADVKYIDPTYMIRAIATTSPDRVYCKVLAHNAVHGAFAGFTGAASSEPKFSFHICCPVHTRAMDHVYSCCVYSVASMEFEYRS
jgi:6-phosphofructokinase